jgi:hydrogenase maturation protease
MTMHAHPAASRRALDTRSAPETVKGHAVRVIGTGRLDRGDDAVGRHAARTLRRRLPARIAVVECPGEMYDLIEAWEGAEAVIIIDGVSSGAPPGTLFRLDARRDPLPPDRATSMHGFGLSAAIELARTLDLLPPLVIVYGVEGDDFGPGHALSTRVHLALDWVTALVASEAAGLDARAGAHEPAA